MAQHGTGVHARCTRFSHLSRWTPAQERVRLRASSPTHCTPHSEPVSVRRDVTSGKRFSLSLSSHQPTRTFSCCILAALLGGASDDYIVILRDQPDESHDGFSERGETADINVAAAFNYPPARRDFFRFTLSLLGCAQPIRSRTILKNVKYINVNSLTLLFFHIPEYVRTKFRRERQCLSSLRQFTSLGSLGCLRAFLFSENAQQQASVLGRFVPEVQAGPAVALRGNGNQGQKAPGLWRRLA